MSALDIELETLWELKKPKLMDSARQETVDKVLMDSSRKKPEDKVCDPADTACNAPKDCEALEDGTELKEGILRESADKASRDKVLLENLESSKEPDIGGSKNNLKQGRFSGDIKTYKRRIKSSALKSVAKKQDVDVLVPPGNADVCVLKTWTKNLSGLSQRNQMSSAMLMKMKPQVYRGSPKIHYLSWKLGFSELRQPWQGTFRTFEPSKS